MCGITAGVAATLLCDFFDRAGGGIKSPRIVSALAGGTDRLATSASTSSCHLPCGESGARNTCPHEHEIAFPASSSFHKYCLPQKEQENRAREEDIGGIDSLRH